MVERSGTVVHLKNVSIFFLFGINFMQLVFTQQMVYWYVKTDVKAETKIFCLVTFHYSREKVRSFIAKQDFFWVLALFNHFVHLCFLVCPLKFSEYRNFYLIFKHFLLGIPLNPLFKKMYAPHYSHHFLLYPAIQCGKVSSDKKLHVCLSVLPLTVSG